MPYGMWCDFFSRRDQPKIGRPKRNRAKQRANARHNRKTR